MKHVIKRVLGLTLSLMISLNLGTPVLAETSNDTSYEAQQFIKNADSFTNVSDGVYVFEKTKRIPSPRGLAVSLPNIVSFENYEKEIMAVVVSNESEKSNFVQAVNSLRSNNLLRAGGSGTITQWDWDSSGASKVTLTVSYTLSSVEGNEFIRINTVSGETTRPGSGISISQKVEYGLTGYYPGGFQVKQAEYKPNLNGPWSVSIPSSWKAVATAQGCTAGANAYVTLKRGSSSWKLHVANDIVVS